MTLPILRSGSVARVKGMVFEAMRQCADMLEDCSDFAGRDELVDIPRLINDLRGPKELVMKNLASKRRALQFLKF